MEANTSRLLNISTGASSVTTNAALATSIAPAASATFDSNRFLRSGKKRGADRFITVNANEMATEVMLATEGAPARSLGTYVGFEPIWIMGGHVGL